MKNRALAFFVLYVVAVVVGYVALVWGGSALLLSCRTENSTTLQDGWSVVVHASSPVEVLAYSDIAAEAPRLLGQEGNVVLVLQPEIVPTRFAASGTLNPGVYVLDGATTTLIFSGSGFVSFENPRDVKTVHLEVFFGWVSYTVILGLFFIVLYFVVRREEKEKMAGSNRSG